jgi:hypothetical protein
MVLLVVIPICLAAGPAPAPIPTDRPDPAVLPPALPSVGTPATVDDRERLAKADPIAFLNACRTRYLAEVHGYRCTLIKQERIHGKLNDREVIAMAVRAEPYAVLLMWKEGAKKTLGSATEGTLYVAGENNGAIIACRPSSFLKTLTLRPTDAAPRAAARYSIAVAGIGHAMERTVRAWTEARDRGHLKAEYLGKKPVPELNGRVCYHFRRTAPQPELDSFTMHEPAPDPATRPADVHRYVELFIDAEHLIQVGSVLTNDAGGLVGSYYFRDVELNPAFPRDQFTTAAFRKP